MSPEDQKYVLAAYIYRGTIENQRVHPDAVQQAGGTLPLISDARWLEITDFEVTDRGTLNHKTRHCYVNHLEVPEYKVILDAWSIKQRGVAPHNATA